MKHLSRFLLSVSRSCSLIGGLAILCVCAPKNNTFARTVCTRLAAPPPADSIPTKAGRKKERRPAAEIRLLIADSLVPIGRFPEEMDPGLFEAPKKYFRDLGGDEQEELLIQYYSGGAHCCNVTDIFILTRDKIYRRIFEFWGDLKFSHSRIVCNFYESVGYFFTCYACSVDDSIPSSHFTATMRFRYSHNKCSLAPHDAQTDSSIRKDLRFLRKRGIPPTDSTEANFDDGTRKAYAERIIAFYFNNQMNLATSHQLFHDFYDYPDRDAVWKEIVEDIQSIKSLNTW